MVRIAKTTALEASLAAILSVVVIEGFAGFVNGSLALLTDSAHAAFDTLSTFTLLIATTLALKPADEDHTYGHGKIESLGALTGGMVLLFLAAVIIVEALLRFGSEVPLVHPTVVGYAAAAYTMGVDVFRITLLTLALRTGGLSIKADLYHAISDFFSTALVLFALALTSLGYPVGDAVVSIVLAVLLVYLSAKLIHSSALDLSDSVSGKLVQSIFAEIRRTDDVLSCKELRVRRVGDVTYVDAVITVAPHVQLVDAETIASRVEANLGKLLGKSVILVHVEPLEWQIPVELQIRSATSQVKGAQGLHNLSVAAIDGGLYVTLHVQVDPTLDLEHAHEIASSIEKGIEDKVGNVKRVTVHLEPSLPERISGQVTYDKELSETIRSIVEAYPGVLEINSITTYYAGSKLHVNVHCVFEAELAIGQIHDMMSKIEQKIGSKLPEAIITIHPEPTPLKWSS